MKRLNKIRAKFILSRSRTLYKIILDAQNEQVTIIWLILNIPRIYRIKREMHYVFCDKGLDVEYLSEESKSVTYKCPKDIQDEVLRIVSKF